MKNLANKIIETSAEIKKHLEEDSQHPNVTSLRELIHFCSNRLLESSNKLERLLCFFISCFIESFFSNFGIDTPYDEELQHVRVSFYKNLVVTFEKLGTAIINEDEPELIKSLSNAINDYIEKINLVNNTF